jgi:hypothetical protein
MATISRPCHVSFDLKDRLTKNSGIFDVAVTALPSGRATPKKSAKPRAMKKPIDQVASMS